ncbi:hypothetical protein Pfo_023539 [Paulownia fortunei]|nr:hypothetical protein Pfo_023539 [Paulownia fortunei]
MSFLYVICVRYLVLVGICVMESQEVKVIRGISNGGVVISNGNGLEQEHRGNGSVQVGGDEKGKENLAEEFLEGFDEYWEDISDRLMISRMVSDSVIKGMVTAVEQEAAEKIAAKELEVANLKECLQSHEVGTGKYDVRLPVMRKAYKVGNYGRFSCFTEACVKNEKMREDLLALRNLAREQFKKAKKEVERARGSNSMKKIGSGSDLVGLGGILPEKQSESWMHVDKMLECLKTTVDSVCTKVDDILLSSKISLCESQQDLDILAKLEDIVIQSVLRSLREENLLEQNAQLCGIQTVNWLEKFNDISGLGTQLDAILKSLSIPETGLVSHGSHDLDHLHHKAFSNHVTPPTSFYGENGTLDASNIHVAESYDFQQLKHMSKEELVNYFNNIITKMRRDHESVLQQKTEEYFRLKREYLKERGSFVTHRKDEEFDVLRKKIPEVISKLEDFLLENERFPALTNNLESMGKLKHRLESLLSENHQLRDCLNDKKNEAKCLEARFSGAVAELLQRSLAEENMLKLVENLKSAVEDSCMEASLNEEVYKSALREQIAQTRCDSEDSNMEFLMTREIYDIILREAAIPAETANRYEIEDSDIESWIMQGLSGLIFTEAIKDAGRQLNDLYQEALIDKKIRICLETKALEKENELRLEVEEKEKLKQEILDLETALKQKEKLAMDLSLSLSKEREQFELASRELSSLREHASRQQTLVTESNRDLESLKSQQLEALRQIEVDKMEMHKLNQKLDETKEVITEANKERNKAFAIAQEMLDKLLLSEAREETLKKDMEMAANGLSNLFDDFECGVSGAIKKNSLRLEDTSSHLRALTKMANGLRRTKLIYKQKLEQRCADLQKAEAEVDLLGDEVDALLGLLEKIYIALDHYSPVLKHYPGITEILELVRREVSGESTMLS